MLLMLLIQFENTLLHILKTFLLKERSDGGGTISRLFECMSVCLSEGGRPNAPKIATTTEYCP